MVTLLNLFPLLVTFLVWCEHDHLYVLMLFGFIVLWIYDRMTAREGFLEAEKLGLSKEQLSILLPIVDATSSDSGRSSMSEVGK